MEKIATVQLKIINEIVAGNGSRCNCTKFIRKGSLVRSTKLRKHKLNKTINFGQQVHCQDY